MMVGWMDGWIANRLGENSCRFIENYVQISYNLHDIYLPLFSKSLDLGSEQPLFQEIWQAIGRGPRRSPISKICPDPSPTRPAKFVSPFRAPDSELSLIWWREKLGQSALSAAAESVHHVAVFGVPLSRFVCSFLLSLFLRRSMQV